MFKTTNSSTAKKLLWYVFVEGSIFYGLLITLPARIIANVILDAVYKLLFQDQYRFASEQLSQWTYAQYTIRQILLHLFIGFLIGIMLFSRDKQRGRIAYPAE